MHPLATENGERDMRCGIADLERIELDYPHLAALLDWRSLRAGIRGPIKHRLEGFQDRFRKVLRAPKPLIDPARIETGGITHPLRAMLDDRVYRRSDSGSVLLGVGRRRNRHQR